MSHPTLTKGSIFQLLYWQADPALINPRDPVSGYAGIPRNMTGIGHKLKEAGYATHMVGKWDAGLATPEHTPLGRGFDSWLGFYGHANDYWTYDNTLKATGHIDNCLNLFTDFFAANATYRGRAPAPAGCDAPAGVASCYEDQVFVDEVVRLITAHDAAAKPLFMLYAPGLLHTPLQVASTYLSRVDALTAARGGSPFDSTNRRTYAAMTLFLDDAVGAIVDALKVKRMWEQTLFVFASDNGGPTYEPGAANNHPLRGGKFSDFEGGVNAVTLVAGGFVPAKARGHSDTVISIADWYATLCEIAGVDPTDQAAAAANDELRRLGLPLLPPIDSVPQWKSITSGTNGRPGPLHLSPKSIVRWPYKLVTGYQFSGDHWQGPVYPNCTGFSEGRTPTAISFFRAMGGEIDFFGSEEEERRLSYTSDCTSGCLFDLSTDPTEHHDLAREVEHKALLHELIGELARLNETIFDPDRGSMEIAHCIVALEHGAYGPFVDADSCEYFRIRTRAPCYSLLTERVFETRFSQGTRRPQSVACGARRPTACCGGSSRASMAL